MFNNMDRQQTQKVITVFFGIGVVLLAIVIGFSYFGNMFRTYKHPTEGFSIKYPARWTVQENFSGASVVLVSPIASSLDYFQESVNVVVQDMTAQPMSLVDYTSTAVTQMKVVFKQRIEILDSGPTTLGGLPAHKFVFIGKGPDGDIQYHSVWTIKGFKAYQVTFTSLASQYSFYEKDLARMFRSFRVR